MGMSFKVYLGAYLVVPTVPRTVVTPVIRCSASCGGTRFVRVAGAQVCQRCGAKAIHESCPATVCKPMRLEELGDEYVDMLWSPESCSDSRVTIWLPNHRGIGSTFSEDGAPAPSDLAALDAQALATFKERFLAEYAPLVEAITAHMGVAPLVQVGVVPYWT